MNNASVNSIETFGLVDGPGIRCVVFFNGCKLRCKYCHNPETWNMGNKNMDEDSVFHKIMRCKPYFKRNNGGVTFSGGEPLLHKDFLIPLMKRLKNQNIHIAIDTSGVGVGDYEEILKYVDLVLLDIKHIDEDEYYKLTGYNMDEFYKFLNYLNKSGKDVWIRQVILPNYNDNIEYITGLSKFLKQINNIKRVDFLPYHSMGKEKYNKLGIDYCLKNITDMDKEKCNLLYKQFISIYWKN